MFSSTGQPVARDSVTRILHIGLQFLPRADELDGIRGLCMNILLGAHEGNTRAVLQGSERNAKRGGRGDDFIRKRIYLFTCNSRSKTVLLF